MADSGQKYIKRNRAPRVTISYKDPYDANANVELPFVMGILADLSGNASAKDKPSLEEREFKDIGISNFNTVMSGIQPAVALNVPNKLSDDEGKLSMVLTFRNMDDFDPGKIAMQVPALKALLEKRNDLANLQRRMNGRMEAQRLLKQALSDPEMLRALGNTTDRSEGTSELE